MLKNRGNIYFIEPGNTLKVGDIEVTPYTVDHSVLDAYMFLIHASGKNILHMGDFRDHGHRGHIKKNDKYKNIILEVIRHYVKDQGKRKINTLITEGTMLTRLGEESYSEKQMLLDAAAYFKDHKYVFLKVSSTNVDSLATFEKAAKRNGFKMYVSRYLLEQIEVYRAVSEKYKTNMYDFSNVCKYPLFPHEKDCESPNQIWVSKKQREEMRKKGFLIVVDSATEKYYDEFSDLPVSTIYSMWKGYLDKNHKAFSPKLYEFWQKTNPIYMHTSGHAYPSLIEKVIKAVNPTDAIIPIHSEAINEFYNLNISEDLKKKIVIRGEMKVFKKNLVNLLRKRYNNNSIKWPSGVKLAFDGNNCLLTLNASKIKKDNMQTDANAFEGWAISAYLGLGEQYTIVLDTDMDLVKNDTSDDVKYLGKENLHQNRFLYRAKKFSEQYEWFKLSSRLQQAVDDFTRFLNANFFTNNLPNKEAKSLEKISNPKPETIAEIQLSTGDTLKKQLLGKYDVGNGKVYRQLPVGLFINDLAKCNEIFPRKSAAIDMWSINGDVFQMFELKASNKMLGQVSEAFFYSNYIRDLKIAGGLFKINEKHERFRGYQEFLSSEITSIKGIMLSDDFHPLITRDLLEVLNSGSEKHINYEMFEYVFDESWRSKKTN